MLDPAFGYLIIIGIALLFAGAGAHKVRDFARFTEVFAAYRMLPDASARRIAWLIPALEFGVAISLVFHSGRRVAVPTAIALLIAYAAGIGLNLLRGRRDLDCGCGGPRDRRPIAAWMVWRNLSLAVVLGLAALPWSPRPLDSTDFLTIMGGLIAGAALYAAVDRLLGDVAPKALLLRGTS
ncbi:MAG TPA: MauE/DoxX family redox-associated membrane protein [Steroidobacteraceae bacterium]